MSTSQRELRSSCLQNGNVQSQFLRSSSHHCSVWVKGFPEPKWICLFPSFLRELFFYHRPLREEVLWIPTLVLVGPSLACLKLAFYTPLSSILYYLDSDLLSILRCKPSLKSDPRIRYATICYYRSCPMTREQLQAYSNPLGGTKILFKRTQHWTNICRIARPGQVIAIRYIGKTAYPSSPYQRFHEELQKGRGSLVAGSNQGYLDSISRWSWADPFRYNEPYLHMHPRLGVSSWVKPLGQQQVSIPQSSTLLGI